MKLYVGQAKLVGPLSRYAGRFNLLEVGAEPGRCPRPATLRRWRSEVPKGFVFSVRLGKSVGGFEADSEQALEFGLAAAEALEAKWLLLQTPASLGPGQRNRDRLKKLFERLLTSGRQVAWDPRGVWDEAEILPIISEVEVQWARDASRYPMVEEPLAYARIPALGTASRVGLGLAERAGENLRGFEEAYVVIEGEGAGRAAQIIRDIATAEDDEDGTPDDGVEELSTSGPRRTSLAARAGEEDESGADEESDDELDEDDSDEDDSDEDDSDEDDSGEDDSGEDDSDEDDSGEDDSDEDDSDEDDSDEDDSDEDDSDEDDSGEDDLGQDDSDDKPREIDDSDLPWGGPSKKRSR